MIKAYKGFKKDMTCRDFQFAEGKEYVYDGEVKVCESGFHACERPLDCFDYYNPAESVYHEVELSDDISKSSDDTKVAAKKIKIGARLDIARLIKAQFEYVKEHATYVFAVPVAASAGSWGAASAGSWGAASAGENGAASAGSWGAASAGSWGAAIAGDNGAASAGKNGAASAGYKGAASVGDNGAASAGYKGVASAGSWGAASAGDNGAASVGYKGAASAGSWGAASAGYEGAASAGSWGAASAGDNGAASAGYKGVAVSRGTSEVGENGIACARGNNCKVKGGMGAVLVIAEENGDDYDIISWKAFMIDGKKYKPDTWYCLKDGEPVEAEE